MAEYITKHEAMKAFAKAVDVRSHQYSYARLMIKALPAADVRPVVLCADCKHFTCGANDVESWAYCNFWHYDVDPTDFCSYGVKREES